MGAFRRLLASMFVAMAMMCARGAMADVIDGNWCYPDGRHFSIRGPDIVTPAGTSAKGKWSRHSFSYQVPPPESDGGQWSTCCCRTRIRWRWRSALSR